MHIHIFFSEKSTEDLIKDLENLWDNFLNSISSSVSDYLSVEHLGLILNRLAEQGKMTVEYVVKIIELTTYCFPSRLLVNHNSSFI